MTCLALFYLSALLLTVELHPCVPVQRAVRAAPAADVVDLLLAVLKEHPAVRWAFADRLPGAAAAAPPSPAGAPAPGPSSAPDAGG